MRTLPELIDAFLAENEDARLWDSGDPEAFTDAADCDTVSIAFARFAESVGLPGIRTEEVHATYPGGEDVHYFNVLPGGVALDWTARQFHNVEDFPLDADQIACPLLFVWPGYYPLPSIVTEVTR